MVISNGIQAELQGFSETGFRFRNRFVLCTRLPCKQRGSREQQPDGDKLTPNTSKESWLIRIGVTKGRYILALRIGLCSVSIAVTATTTEKKLANIN